MSLFGSGRREGVAAAITVAVTAVLVHLGGILWALRSGGEFPYARLASGVVAGIGCVLSYRFLRAMGRSRYASFLAGAAYGLSTVFTALAVAPGEQLAAALAPLCLEAAWRLARPTDRWTWAPWFGPCAALPFVGGVCTAALAATIAVLKVVHTMTRCELDARPAMRRTLFAGAATATLALAPLWLAAARAPGPPPILPQLEAGELLAAITAGSKLDVAAVLRVPGPLLLFLVLLGILRRQRQSSTLGWLALAVAGAAMSWGAARLPSPSWLPGAWHALSAVALWPCILAATVLGASGLDDFLDLPQRKRHALAALLALIAAALPAAVNFGTRDPAREWPTVLALTLLAVLFPFWRMLGILRFKTVLAGFGLLVSAGFALEVVPYAEPPGIAPLAAPLVETAGGRHLVVPDPPFLFDPLGIWGTLAALGLALLWAMTSWVRRLHRRTIAAA